MTITNLDGKVSKHYGGYLPEGYYHVVLNVEAGKKDWESFGNEESGVWELCVLGPANNCIQQSPELAPAIGSHFNPGGFPKSYKLTVVSFKSHASAEIFREILIGKGEWKDYQISPELDFVTKKNQEDYITDSFTKFSDSLKKIKVNQTTDQQLVQSLISKNATKITDLEKQLRELRLIQKGLKKQR